MKQMKSLRFDSDLWDALKIKADEENRSLTNLIETILWSWIRSH